MKSYVAFLTLTLMSIIGFGQVTATIDSILPIDEKTGLIQYQEVIELQGTPSELYDRAEAWIKDYFPNPAGVIGKRSKEDGYINGTVRIRLLHYDRKGNVTGAANIVYFDMKLEFKENRFRYTFSDFKLQAVSNFPLERWLNPESPYFDERNLEQLMQLRKEVESLIDKLDEAMQPKEEENDDW